MPRDVLVARPRAEEVKSAADVRDSVPPILRRFTSPHDAIPRTHLLSNGRYAVMVTAAGSGYSRWGDLAVTRWREDVTRDPWGSYLFVRDMHTGAVWSAGSPAERARGRQLRGRLLRGPRRVLAPRRLDRDRPDRRRLGRGRRRDPARVAHQPRLAGPRDRADVVRRDRARAAGRRRRPPGLPEPVRPDRVRCRSSARCWRRAGRGPATRQPIWAAHVARRRGATPAASSSTRPTAPASSAAAARSARRPRSSTAVRCRTRSARCSTRSSACAAGSRSHPARRPTRSSPPSSPSRASEVLDLADKYRDSATFERAATLAWTQAQVQLHHLGIEPDEAHLFQRLANRILYSDPSLRPPPGGARQQRARRVRASGPHGISGDLPIVLVRIDEARGPRHRSAAAARPRVLAPQAARRRPRDPQRARRHLRPGPPRLARGRRADEPVDRSATTAIRGHGGVYILRGDQLSADDRTLLRPPPGPCC